MAAEARPGRSCPPAYGYGARALARPATSATATLYVAGGLYGNVFALERLLEMFEAEPGEKALVFNGDFHWFDIAPQDFERVTQSVLAHRALRGNVETELSGAADAGGCGCAYPEFVDDGVVVRSNRIMGRLRRTAEAFPALTARLSALPMHDVVEVGGVRVGIVHGDADSLAGWGFSQEVLATPVGLRAARAAFDKAGVQVFASSHSCLPVLLDAGDGRLVVNNGAAGMPNFRATGYGIATRISARPGLHALYGARSGGLHVEAIPIRYDGAAWEQRFLEQWPPGSEAHESYFGRIAHGPAYEPSQALRVVARKAA